MAKHVCRNAFNGDGAKGACFVEIEATEAEGIAFLKVGHSCTIPFSGTIPVTWLSEVIAIAAHHEGGIAGFLAANEHLGGGYALECDPAPTKEPTHA